MCLFQRLSRGRLGSGQCHGFGRWGAQIDAFLQDAQSLGEFRWGVQSKAYLRDVQGQGRLHGLGRQGAQSEAHWQDMWCCEDAVGLVSREFNLRLAVGQAGPG